MFQTTRWSVVLSARGESEDAHLALERLCSAYRAPVLAYVRRHARSREEAEDLTQAFFLKFLERRGYAAADPARGRFRAFLLTALTRFLSDAREHAHAAKRGNGRAHASIDDATVLPEADPNESPERTFERAWALAVLSQAVERLAREAEASGKREMFQHLREFLIEQPEPSRYEQVAEKLGMRRNTLAVTVHRLRERMRELVLAELAETVSDRAGLDAEMLALRDALTRH